MQVNEERGHAAADAVLRAVAAVVADTVRAGDLVARYGGEEFGVALETSREAAAVIAERVRAAVAATPVAVPPGEAVAVTTSAGIASGASDEAAEEPLAKADIGLAMAKRAGRNTVVEVG